MVKAQIYTVSLLDFINSISQTDDIQDVSAQTVGGRVDLLAPRRGGGRRPTAPTPWLRAWIKLSRRQPPKEQSNLLQYTVSN